MKIVYTNYVTRLAYNIFKKITSCHKLESPGEAVDSIFWLVSVIFASQIVETTRRQRGQAPRRAFTTPISQLKVRSRIIRQLLLISIIDNRHYWQTRQKQCSERVITAGYVNSNSSSERYMCASVPLNTDFTLCLLQYLDNLSTL